MSPPHHKPNVNDKSNNIIFGKVLPPTTAAATPPVPTPMVQTRTTNRNRGGDAKANPQQTRTDAATHIARITHTTGADAMDEVLKTIPALPRAPAQLQPPSAGLPGRMQLVSNQMMLSNRAANMAALHSYRRAERDKTSRLRAGGPCARAYIYALRQSVASSLEQSPKTSQTSQRVEST
ncbi:hypothetical protein AC578_7359 [Pseudocercospora eumusae]|uniref:Uncharacterized protein n=1 Tax=Pseudocercospora eumusae TaxID=321146 RepID=A0A139H4T5_9PEZI|nr:hypothetical protein AC578_7359 [Pseudocercospora eumusae]